MSTTNDLREALHQHAHDIDQSAQPDRVDAVRGRIRRTTRRRRVSAVGVVLALVAVGAGLSLHPPHLSGPTQHPDSLAGHTVPQTTMSLGAVYRYVQGVEGTGSVSLHLAPTTSDRLVRWDSASARGRIALHGIGDPAFSLPAGNFGTFVLVPSGASYDLSVRQTGSSASAPVGLAVYGLDTPAPGYTRFGVTFRRDVVGQRLVAAAVGRPGQGRVTLTVPPGGPVTLRGYCSGAPSSAWATTESVGMGGISGGCQASDDPGSAEASSQVVAASTEPRRVTTFLSDPRGRPVDSTGRVLVGVAAYAGDHRFGAESAAVREVDGHRWTRTEVFTSRFGAPRLRLRLDARRPLLMAVSVTGHGRGSMDASSPDGPIGVGFQGPFYGGSSSSVELSTGSTVRYHAAITGTSASSHLRIAIAVYRLAD